MNSNDTKHDAKHAASDAAHSAAADKAKGHVKEVIGTVKEKVGGAVGADKLEAEGRLQHAEGKKDVLKGEFKEKIEDVKDKIKAGAEVIADKVKGVRR